MPEFTLEILYHAHVSSVLNYCNKSWANTYQTHLNPILILQKRMVRTLTNSDYLAHTQPLFHQLKILPIDKLKQYHLAIYFHKNRNSLLTHLQGHHNHFTRNRDRPRPAPHTRSLFENSFVYQAPKLWNDLLDHHPEAIALTNISSFKKQLKNILLSN